MQSNVSHAQGVMDAINEFLEEDKRKQEELYGEIRRDIADLYSVISGKPTREQRELQELLEKQQRIAYENSFEGQLARIHGMQQKLQTQLTTISESQSQNQLDIEKFKQEIVKEKKLKRITSYAQATERMKYNIQLIREMDAYQAELSKIKQVTEQGMEEAMYSERSFCAKERMAKVVGGGKALGQEVDKLLEKYGPLMNQYAIDPKKLTVKSPEETWKQVVGRSYFDFLGIFL
jgi:hypothetical protein